MKKTATKATYFSLCIPCGKKIIPVFLFCFLSVHFISAQQVVGSFPSMDGGFEGQSGTLATTTTPVTSAKTAYSRNLVGVTGTINSTGGRSGPKSMSVATANSGEGFYTPTAGLAQNTSYVIQYYFKYPGTSNRNFNFAATCNGGTNWGGAAALGNVNGVTAWTKATTVKSTSNHTATTYGMIRLTSNGGGISTAFEFDDFCVYAGSAADVVAPGDVTLPSTAYVSTTQLNVSWTAPAGGVDGGGYLVVRYATDPTGQASPNPNVNGIYAVGNTIGTDGTVAYIGTATSFSNTGLAPNTFYYYRVYTVDKAFNYSPSPITFGGLTTAAVTPAVTLNIPGTPAADITQASVTDIIYSFSLTSTAQFAALTQLTFPTTNLTYDANDFVKFELYANNSNTFPDAAPIATITGPANLSLHTFAGFNKLIPYAGSTYFWITADVGVVANATVGNSIRITPDIAAGNLTFVNPSTTVTNGSITASGAQTIIAPSNYTWNGSVSTNWTIAGNWTPNRNTLRTTDRLTFPAGTWTSTNVPTQTISALYVTGNATLTPATAGNILTIKNVSGLGLDDLTVYAGGKLTIGTGLTTTFFDATTADISGTLEISSGATLNTNATNASTTVTNAAYPLMNDGIIINYGTLAPSSAAKLIINSGAVYNHKIDGGTIPTATWNTNSTCLISAIVDAQAISGHAQTFSKFVWDCPGQNKTHFILGQNVSNASPIIITDSLIVKRTNSKILQLTSTGGQNDLTCGSFIQYGGIVAVTYNTDAGGVQRSLTVNNTFYVADSITSDARFQIINNPGSTYNIKGRLYIKGNVEMHPVLLSATLEATKGASNPSVAEIIFTGTIPQWLRFSSFAGNIDFVNNHTSTGVSLLSNAIANNFDQKQGVFYINGNTLTINGAVTYNTPGTGLFGGSSTSNLTIGGAAGTLKFYTGYQVLKDFIQLASSSATLGTELSITAGTAPGRDSLGVGATLTTNDNLILRSDIDGTARMARVPVDGSGIAQATINGKVAVERYLPMGTGYDSRRWRLLTAPFKVTNSPTISAAWQEGAVCTDRLNPSPLYPSPSTPDPKPGYGTHITVSTVAANGFDQGSRNNASIFIHNNLSNTWSAPANTNSVKITDNKGVYMLFARGDRSIVIVDQFVSAKPTTLDPKGELNLGNVSVGMETSGLQPVGNPYASAIKLDNIDFNGTLGNIKQVYLWDPKALGSNNVGKFITCQGDGNSPTTYTYTGNSSSYDSRPGVIESSGAFMVKATGGNITFHETDKIFNSSTIGVASRPNAHTTGDFGTISKLYTDLNVIKNGEPVLADGAASVFNRNYVNGIDEMDASKLFSFNTTELLFIKREGLAFSIERRKKLNVNDTIFFSLYRLNQASYQFGFRPNDFDNRYLAFLQDNFTGKLTPVDMLNNSVYNFKVTADPASAASNRFYIIFKRAIPAKPVTAAATQDANDIAVSWDNPDNEYEVPYYVERSINGEPFTTVAAYTSENTENKFSWIDEKAPSGSYLYRIRYTSEDGETKYSNTASVEKNVFTGNPFVYPNPVRNGQIGLQMGSLPAGTYSVRLMDINGRLIQQQTINHQGNTVTKTIGTKQVIAAGTYNLEIRNDKKTVAVIQVLMK
ncbi:MAG: T9SS type A sorting domain-containing protein [Ferruginibacter sp.]